MQAIEFTELEAPASFYSEKEVGAVVLGRVLFRDDRRPVVLALEDWYGDHCASMLRSENSRHRVSGHIVSPNQATILRDAASHAARF